MRILFVSPRQCWPTVSGAKLREYHIAKALGRRSKLQYVFFADPHRPPPTKADLPFCEAIKPVAPIRAYSTEKLVRGVWSKWPLSALNYTSPEMTRALKDAASSEPFDIVHLDLPHLAPYQSMLQGLLPNARIVYDWHNIESDLLWQYAERGPSLPHRVYSRFTARKMVQLEKYILGDAFGHLVCSDREKEILCQLAPGARIQVIENGVDTQRFAAVPSPNPVRRRLIFVGLMNYHANVEAAVWFVQTIWAEIRKLFPQLTLTLVGADPVPEVRALARMEQVEVTGTVPEVTPYYKEALAAVVPLQSGGGTRLKILEAMAAAVPVISTPIGAEGLMISPGENIILVQEQPREWAEAIAALAPMGTRWMDVATAGRKLVESRYDWEALGLRTFETYQRWIKE